MGYYEFILIIVLVTGYIVAIKKEITALLPSCAVKSPNM